jgi:hypothetical protein
MLNSAVHYKKNTYQIGTLPMNLLENVKEGNNAFLAHRGIQVQAGQSK